MKTLWFSTYKKVQASSVYWHSDGFRFEDSESVIMIYDLEKEKKTINGQHYAWGIKQLNEVIKSKYKDAFAPG